MLQSAIIEKLKKENESEERPFLEIPAFPPKKLPDQPHLENEEEKTESESIIVIDLV